MRIRTGLGVIEARLAAIAITIMRIAILIVGTPLRISPIEGSAVTISKAIAAEAVQLSGIRAWMESVETVIRAATIVIKLINVGAGITCADLETTSKVIGRCKTATA